MLRGRTSDEGSLLGVMLCGKQCRKCCHLPLWSGGDGEQLTENPDEGSVFPLLSEPGLPRVVQIPRCQM